MSELGFNVPPTTRSNGDGTWFTVSSERPEKRGIDLAIPRLVIWRVIHYCTAASLECGTLHLVLGYEHNDSHDDLGWTLI